MELLLVALFGVVGVFAASWVVTLSWVVPAVGEFYLGRKVTR